MTATTIDVLTETSAVSQAEIPKNVTELAEYPPIITNQTSSNEQTGNTPYIHMLSRKYTYSSVFNTPPRKTHKDLSKKCLDFDNDSDDHYEPIFTTEELDALSRINTLRKIYRPQVPRILVQEQQQNQDIIAEESCPSPPPSSPSPSRVLSFAVLSPRLSTVTTPTGDESRVVGVASNRSSFAKGQLMDILDELSIHLAEFGEN
ncbi:UNVERIFIED_CONTAM: hypothetical protein HDU68_003276 [Siphonaria sp. JEL0065]|nr:hypothetical protein HDU68_003276 [Siphonaria sp. JEL0065]